MRIQQIIIFLNILICLFCCETIWAQEQSHNKSNAPDTTLVDSLLQKGYDLWIRNPSKSIELGNKAYNLASKLQYDKGAAFAKRVSGVGYWTLGESRDALFDLYKSLDLYQNLDDLEGISNVKLNIGMVYAEIDEDSLALRHYQEAINGFTTLNLENRIATVYTKLGTLQIETGRLDKAHTNITNALNIHTKNNFEYGMSEAHNRLGRIYLEQHKLEQADYHLRQSLTLVRRIDDKDGMVNNLLQFGRLFSLEKEYELADMHFKLALSRANEMNLKNYKLHILKNLSELKSQVQESDSALYYFTRYVELKDSLFTIKKSHQIAGLEFRNEIQQKDKELKALSKSQKQSKTIQWILIGGLWIIGLLSISLIKSIRVRSKTQKQILEQQNIIAQKELENQKLRGMDLEGELSTKNRELTSYAMNVVQKNQILEEFENKISEAKNTTSLEKTKKILSDLQRMIKVNQGNDKDWEDFKRYFEDVHPEFFTHLKHQFPNLSANDLKVASLTRLNLSIKEASNILGISPESTKTARYRLRKKMKLSSDTDLFDFLLQF